VEEAREHLRNLIPQQLAFSEPDRLPCVAEDHGAVLAELGDHQPAVLLLGAADAMRERLGTPRDPAQQADIAEPIAKARTALPTQEWNDAHQTGRNTTVEDALNQAHAAEPST
jgi:hypothetical protein